jgi:hypothetical protein
MPRDVAAGWDAGADFVVAKDLVTSPADWRGRLREVLAGARGRPDPAPLEWQGESADPACGPWAGLVNGALHHPCLRHVGREVLDVVLRKGLRVAFGDRVPHPELNAWMVPGEGRLDPHRAPASPPPESLDALRAALEDQLWRLLGAEAGRPAFRALSTLSLRAGP